MSKPNFEAPIRVDADDIMAAHMYFRWGQETVGGGECSIHRRKDGTITADTECMGKEWLRRALYAAVDALVERAEIL